MYPNDVLFEVLKNLEFDKVMQYSTLSKQFYSVSTNDYLWKHLCHRDITQNIIDKISQYKSSYYKIYKTYISLETFKKKQRSFITMKIRYACDSCNYKFYRIQQPKLCPMCGRDSVDVDTPLLAEDLLREIH